MSRLVDDNKEYAKLLASINIANTGLRRPLSPIQTSQYIQRLSDEEGKENVSLLLPIQNKIISDFLNLLKLPEQCHEAIVWGVTKDYGVGFSASAVIATLKDPSEQLLLFTESSKHTFDVESIKEIVTFYKNKKNDLSFMDVIKKITNTRPEKTQSYLVVISISDNSNKKLEDLSTKQNKRKEYILKDKFVEKFQITNIPDILMKGNNIAITLNEVQYHNYKTQIKKQNLEYDKITEYLVN